MVVQVDSGGGGSGTATVEDTRSTTTRRDFREADTSISESVDEVDPPEIDVTAERLMEGSKSTTDETAERLMQGSVESDVDPTLGSDPGETVPRYIESGDMVFPNFLGATSEQIDRADRETDTEVSGRNTPRTESSASRLADDVTDAAREINVDLSGAERLIEILQLAAGTVVALVIVYVLGQLFDVQVGGSSA